VLVFSLCSFLDASNSSSSLPVASSSSSMFWSSSIGSSSSIAFSSSGLLICSGLSKSSGRSSDAVLDLRIGPKSCGDTSVILIATKDLGSLTLMIQVSDCSVIRI
jgi:hypothetical protein